MLRPENRYAIARVEWSVIVHPPRRSCCSSVPASTITSQLLQVNDPLKKIEELFAVRDPLYREVADIIVNSLGRSIGHLVKQVERELQKQCAA